MYYLFYTTKYNCETTQLDRVFSNAIVLVLLTLKLIYPVFFDAQKGMQPMAQPRVILRHNLF